MTFEVEYLKGLRQTNFLIIFQNENDQNNLKSRIQPSLISSNSKPKGSSFSAMLY